MNSKPQVEQLDTLHAKHYQNMKTIHMISKHSGISINRLVQKNAARFSGVQGEMGSTHRLPPLKSPSSHNVNEFGEPSMPKKIIVPNSSRRTKSLARQRPPQTQPGYHAQQAMNLNSFTFAGAKHAHKTTKESSNRFHSISHSHRQQLEQEIAASNNTMNNSQKRKYKRSFNPRPKASAILGLQEQSEDGGVQFNSNAAAGILSSM